MSARGGKKEKKLIELVETAGKMHQVRIYDVLSSASFLKVYIDNDPPVDLKTCEKFMKSLLFLLESEGLNNRECEVSTPGLERPLKKDWHFRSAIGRVIRVTTRQPFLNQTARKPVSFEKGVDFEVSPSYKVDKKQENASKTSIRRGKKASKGQLGQQVWTGQLDKYQDQALFLSDGLSQRVIPLNIITKACTVFEGQAKKRPKKGQTKKQKEKRP